MQYKILRRLLLLIDPRSNKKLKIGPQVEFITTGIITSVNAYLGYIENKSV